MSDKKELWKELLYRYETQRNADNQTVQQWNDLAIDFDDFAEADKEGVISQAALDFIDNCYTYGDAAYMASWGDIWPIPTVAEWEEKEEELCEGCGKKEWCGCENCSLDEIQGEVEDKG